jgi:hypothetical protein
MVEQHLHTAGNDIARQSLHNIGVRISAERRSAMNRVVPQGMEVALQTNIAPVRRVLSCQLRTFKVDIVVANPLKARNDDKASGLQAHKKTV